MKKTHLIILISALISASVQAQVWKPNSINRANKTVFNVEEEKSRDISSPFVTVLNNKNIYHGHKPALYMDPGLLAGKIEKGTVLKSFKETFSDERLKQLLPEHGIDIKLYILPQGRVSEVEFLIQKTNTVTANELEQLENDIKKNVSFKFSQSDKNGADFFILALSVRYRNILDGVER